MRVSEILSMKAGAIEYRPIGESGVDQAYVVARLFKTVDDPDGRIERWVAPVPVVRAVDLLERLSAPAARGLGPRRALPGQEHAVWRNRAGDAHAHRLAHQ
jgi:hypothetical protein